VTVPKRPADILRRLDPYRELVEAELVKILPAKNEAPKSLHQAMHYTLLGAGKRLRPILTMLSAASFGAAPRKAAPFAAAFELVHTYSLVHDDLPCMDDDDYRRGRLTCHKKFDEATAVLTGDALLTLAFEAIVDAGGRTRLPPARVVMLVKELSRAAGSRGLIAGQIEDLAAEGQRVSLKKLEGIHHRKTGALFTAALRAGAILGGATPRELLIITRFGDLFGRVFQITDDILDVVGDFKTLGKPTGSDSKNEKATYPKLLSLKRAKAIAVDLSKEAAGTLEQLVGRNCAVMQDLVGYLPERVS
jgi:geranylgeranyl diphosphate synthase type II